MRYILPLILFFFCLPSFAKNDDITNVKVTSVYDGDTFKVKLPCSLPVVCDYISVRVRGVDAPEFKTKDSCEKKKAKEAKKNQKVVELKEIWLSMTIDVGDLNVKAKQLQV